MWWVGCAVVWFNLQSRPRACTSSLAQYRPAYKFKLSELNKRRQEIWAWKLRWNDPPPTAEMRRVAHEFANTRVRVSERLPAHEAVLAGGKIVVPPSAPSLHEHRECDASFVGAARPPRRGSARRSGRCAPTPSTRAGGALVPSRTLRGEAVHDDG